MKFTVAREAILKPLQLVAGVVERRHTLAILANVLIVVDDNQLSITGTDLEVEIVGKIPLEEGAVSGEVTVPAKKFLDICRALPDGAVINFSLDEQKVTVKSARSRFSLSTLPPSEFPSVEGGDNDLSFSCAQREIKRLIEKTSFAMAQQDVRYYLNGMLWEARNGELRVVATDGHRLAMCTRPINLELAENRQSILPRKGVIELSRLMEDSDELVEIVLGANHIRALTKSYLFTSKLVDGNFPDYQRVLPVGGDKEIIGDREVLRHAFTRTAILSNEKYRGVRIMVDENLLTIVANNPEQEEAEEKVEVEYDGEPLEVGFNVSYLMDVTSVIDTDKIKITLSDSNSSALIEQTGDSDSAYVVMPMRL
ncbi:MAG: DNA polymerase III subunit beta [Alteromonadaceae bacterium]|nr:MAG: DNA polymerase III subunit beta [Alteromonadaceae bacterium]